MNFFNSKSARSVAVMLAAGLTHAILYVVSQAKRNMQNALTAAY
jgi:hypothetical protein